MSNTLFEEYFKRKYNYLKDNFKAEEEKKLSFCIEQIKILENKIQDYEIKLNENNKLEYKINEITIEFDKIMILYNNLKKENEHLNKKYLIENDEKKKEISLKQDNENIAITLNIKIKEYEDQIKLMNIKNREYQENIKKIQLDFDHMIQVNYQLKNDNEKLNYLYLVTSNAENKALKENKNKELQRKELESKVFELDFNNNLLNTKLKDYENHNIALKQEFEIDKMNRKSIESENNSIKKKINQYKDKFKKLELELNQSEKSYRKSVEEKDKYLNLYKICDTKLKNIGFNIPKKIFKEEEPINKKRKYN